MAQLDNIRQEANWTQHAFLSDADEAYCMFLTQFLKIDAGSFSYGTHKMLRKKNVSRGLPLNYSKKLTYKIYCVRSLYKLKIHAIYQCLRDTEMHLLKRM